VIKWFQKLLGTPLPSDYEPKLKNIRKTYRSSMMEPFTTNFSEKCAASNFWPEIILTVEAARLYKAQVSLYRIICCHIPKTVNLRTSHFQTIYYELSVDCL